jgi:hypothetical protein
MYAPETLYETDFHAWTQTQAMMLRDRQWEKIDLVNLIEEIESLGRQQRQEFRHRLSILIGHLLKWQFQPERRSRSWLATIRVQRIDLADLLEDNPSLKPYLEEALGRAYLKGVALAVGETDLPQGIFPVNCPYSLVEVLADRFYPGDESDLLSE